MTKVIRSMVGVPSRLKMEKGLLKCLAEHFRETGYTSSKTRSSRKESKIRNKLARETGGTVEVLSLCGRIDVLTSTEVIEVKTASDWKSALGQVLAYQMTFLDHHKRIHLFDCPQSFDKEKVERTCKELDVRVTYET